MLQVARGENVRKHEAEQSHFLQWLFCFMPGSVSCVTWERVVSSLETEGADHGRCQYH